MAENLRDTGVDTEEGPSLVQEDAQRSCAVIGPANSGKTTLLFALQQACLQESDDDYLLDFVPQNEATIHLTRAAGNYLFRGATVPASREVTHYGFRVFVEDRRAQTPEYYCSMSVTDGPGGYLFPSERAGAATGDSAWRGLVEHARKAHSLVLCVDASNPSLELLYTALPEFILGVNGTSKKLPHRRVLLLLTKFDRILHNFTANADRFTALQSNQPRSVDGLLASLTSDGSLGRRPAYLAGLLSPVGQVRSQVAKVLSLLQSAVSPSTSLAAGFCSAHGFAPVERSAERGGSIDLSDWQPYGVREALLFLTTDQIRHPMAAVPYRVAPHAESLRILGA